VTKSEAYFEIAEHCAQIAKLFKPGAKVTVLVRNPAVRDDHSADMFVSDDEPDAVIAAVEYLKARPEEKLGVV
jgi:hypothetical protein